MNHKNLKAPVLGLMMIISMLLLTGCNLGEYNAKDSTDKEVMMEKSEGQAMKGKKNNNAMIASYMQGKVQAFNELAYEKAKAENKTVVLDFAADWCPTCQANKPKFKSAVEANGDVVAFEVNYDTEKQLKKNYNVTSQTTYILIKDGKEIDRTLGAKSEAEFTNFIGGDESMERMDKANDQAMMLKSEDEKKMMDSSAAKARKSMKKTDQKEAIMEKKLYVSGIQDYNMEGYKAAVADGKTVALDFHANWCSICIGNKPKLEKAVSHLNNDVIVFVADFDTERALKKEYGVQTQATYLLIKSGKEVKRVTGPQSVDQFKTLLSS